MAERSVIREYLVSLGFKVDETSLKKFTDGLSKAKDLAMEVAAGVAGAAVAGVVMVEKFGDSMEKLYFASLRTKASVANIQALRFAAEQVGVSADTAQASLENMAQVMRTTPGMRAVLDAYVGHSTANEDQVQAMMELLNKLQKMPHFQATQIASLFGIDEQTLYMMEMSLPAMKKAMAERKKINQDAHIDAQKQASDAHAFENQQRLLAETLTTTTNKIADGLVPQMLNLNKQFAIFLDKLSGSSAIGQFITGLNSLLASINRIVAAMGGWQTVLTVLLGMKALSVLSPILLSTAGAIRALGVALVGLTGGGVVGGLALLGKLGLVGAAGAVGWEAGQELNKHTGIQWWLDKYITTPIFDYFHPNVQNREASGKIKRPATPTNTPGKTIPRSIRNNNPGNIEFGSFAKKFGATGSDGRFAIFPSWQAGVAAMHALLMNKYEQGLTTIHSLISGSGRVQGWLGSGADLKDAPNYIANVSKLTGIGADQQLPPSQIAAVQMAMARNEAGGAVPSMNVTNNVTVNGVQEPQRAAAAVKQAVQPPYATAARYANGAMA